MYRVSRCCLRKDLQPDGMEWIADRTEDFPMFVFHGAINCWWWKSSIKGISAHGNRWLPNQSHSIIFSHFGNAKIAKIFMIRAWHRFFVSSFSGIDWFRKSQWQSHFMAMWWQSNQWILHIDGCPLYVCLRRVRITFLAQAKLQWILRKSSSFFELYWIFIFCSVLFNDTVAQHRMYYWVIWIMAVKLMMHSRVSIESLNV